MLSTQPGISLGVQVPQPAAAGGLAANPLGLINTLSELQLRMNQNALFQYQFAARQRAGQIIAANQNGGIDQIANALMSDPLAASGAADTLNTYRQMQSTLWNMNRSQAEYRQSVLGKVMEASAGAIGNPDPSQLYSTINSIMETADPSQRGVIGNAAQDWVRSLTDGLPSKDQIQADPRVAAFSSNVYQNRLIGAALASGVHPDVIQAATGRMAPRVEFQPVGPGGAMVPVQIGTSLYGQPAQTGIEVAGAGGGGVSANALAPGTAAGGSAALGAPSGLVPGGAGGLMGPSVAARAEAEKSGAAAGQISEDLSAAAKNLPEDLNRVNLMQQALGKFQAGGLAGFRSDMASVLQGFKNAGVPISQATIDKVGNESLADTQVFQATVRPEVINELKQAATGTGRVMRSEVDAFLAMMSPNIDPEALRTLLNRAKYQAAVQYDQTQKFQQYRAGGGNPLDFYANYNRTMDPYGLATRAGGGLDFSPIPASQIKGAPSQADLWKGWGEQGQISRTAVERLRKNPALARDFEERFGLPAGGAQQYMGGGQ